MLAVKEKLKPLQELGMHEAFTYGADFSCITSNPLLVRLIKQLSHVAVDEKGVEASAATVIEMENSIEPEPEWIELIIGHPFYFSIDNLHNH